MSKSLEAEQLRHAVLEAIASRHPAALTVGQITRRVNQEKLVDVAVKEAEVDGALEILRGLKLCDYMTDGLGSTRYWKATSEGVLAWERGI